jgi:formylglycine-generating enzyme required for sulfatase activity
MERRTLKTKSGDVLLEFIDGHWIVYPIQPTYWRKDPQALMVMAQESGTQLSEIDQSKLKFESFHIVDLSLGFEKGTFDLGTNLGFENGKPKIDHHWEYCPFDGQFGPLGFSETELYPVTDCSWPWLERMKKEGIVENPDSKDWPTQRTWLNSEIWKEYHRDYEDTQGLFPRVQGILHSTVIEKPRLLFDLLFRWSDSGHRLAFAGNDESESIKRFITEVLESVGESDSLISTLEHLCSPRPTRILLPGLVEWTDMLIPWTIKVNQDELIYTYHWAPPEIGNCLVEEPISLSEMLLEWHPGSGFRLIERKTVSEWGWEEDFNDSGEYFQQDRPATVSTAVVESIFSNQIETGEKLFEEILRFVEHLCHEWRFQRRFWSSEYFKIVAWVGTDPDDQDEFTEELNAMVKEFHPSEFYWSSVAEFLRSFPEIHDDFQRALENSGLLNAVAETSETTSPAEIVDRVEGSFQESTEKLIDTPNVSDSYVEINETESRPRLFRICLECGYWSYTDEKCYLDESELIPISDLQGETRSLGAEMTSPSGIEFVWIPPGSFMMGSPESEEQRDEDEGPQRIVTLGQGFWMGKYEVTQGQYESVVGMNPSVTNSGSYYPVERVSWNDAKEFIKILNDRNDGFVYSLPTEAEWEYAARAGTTTAFAFGNSLSSNQANFRGTEPHGPYGNAANGQYIGKTTKVGSYKPNAWGLYDMHGNVHEWVEDIYQDSYTGLPKDGSANKVDRDRVFSTERRVLRAGGWGSFGRGVRSANRSWEFPDKTTKHSSGLRIVARYKGRICRLTWEGIVSWIRVTIKKTTRISRR